MYTDMDSASPYSLRLDTDVPHSLLLDPRVTHLLITRDSETWTADMTVDGFRSDCTGFKTSSDAYWWAYEEVIWRELL